MNCILGHRLLSFLLLMLLACTRRLHSRHAKPYPKVFLERRKHLFGSFKGGKCILGHRLLSFLLLMLLACTRKRHSRHAKPYPKVILERRKHLFGSFGECELHFWPPKYCLLKTIPKTTPKPPRMVLCFKLFIRLACNYQLTGQQSGLRGARTQRVAGFSTWATAYPSISGGQRVGPAPPPMLVGGLEPASKSMSWSLWGGAASTPFLPSCLPAFLPSCLPAFLPSCLLPLLPSFFFCPASLSASLPLPPFLFLPSSSSLPLPPFLFLPSLPPSFFPCPILPCSLTPWIPLSLPPHPSSLRPFSSCFLFLCSLPPFFLFPPSTLP